MPPAPKLSRLQKRALDDVLAACEERVAAQAHFSDADHQWRLRIIAAERLGCSLDQIASVAGVSKTRVHQIIQQEQ